MTSKPDTTHTLALVGGRLCLDFCNTVEYHDSEHPVHILKNGYPSLIAWSAILHLIDDPQADCLMAMNDSHPDQMRAVFEQATTLREALYQIFVTVIAKAPVPSESLLTLNKAVQQANDHHTLTTQADSSLAWQWDDPNLPDAMLWPIALSAVELLTSDGLDRLRQCPGCGWLFFDQSRNRSRTWCDMQFCGNRSKARRFYQRQKSSEAG